MFFVLVLLCLYAVQGDPQKWGNKMDVKEFLDELCTCEMCNLGFVSEVNGKVE